MSPQQEAKEPRPPTPDATLDDRSLRRALGNRVSLRSTGLLVPVALLFVVFSILSPNFLTTLNMQNLLVQAAAVGVLAFGSTLVIITEEIDLSIGALTGLSAVVAALVAIDAGLPWPLGVAAALGTGLLMGIANGIFTTIVGVPSFITTLAMLGIATGLALQLTGGESIYNFPNGYQSIGQEKILGIGLPVFIALAVLLVLHFMLTRTRVGLNLYAVGGNRHAAAMVGVSPTRAKITALGINGFCAGIAGVIISARLDSANPTFGEADLLNAIAAVVIGGAALTGGIGSVLGTLLGVLMIVTITNGLTLEGVSPFMQQIIIGATILAAATVDNLNRRRQA